MPVALPLDVDTASDVEHEPQLPLDKVAQTVVKKPAAKQQVKKAAAKKPAKAQAAPLQVKKAVKKPAAARRFAKKSPGSLGIVELLHATPGCPVCPEGLAPRPLASAPAVRGGFWEIFSPPRIVPFVQGLGLGGCGLRSVDLESGWDLLNDTHIKHLLEDMQQSQPAFVFLSPPCTYFSQLMYSNWWRMDKDVREQRLRDAVVRRRKLCTTYFELRASMGRPLPKPLATLGGKRP
jgi:hypothetical protein